MASYHCSIKTISRSAGRSVVAAAAYRAGEKLIDDETGMVFDYRKKGGVLSNEIFLPQGAPIAMLNRNALWDAATAKETRGNSTLAREMEAALPAELTQEQRGVLLRNICLEMVQKHGVAVDACMHVPHKKHIDEIESEDHLDDDEKYHAENYHAHILYSTRQLGANGFGKKTREWDDRNSGTVEYWRERVATLTNEALAAAGHETRVDHRSLKDQGITRAPKIRLPRAVFEMNKRGEESDVGEQIQVRKEAAFAVAEIKHERADINVINGDIAGWTKALEQAQMEKLAIEKAEAEAMAQALADAQTVAAAKAQALAQVAAEDVFLQATNEIVTVTKTVLPLTVDALEVKRRLRVDESNKLFGQIQKLDSDRLKAKAGEEIEAAKIALPGLSKRLESLEASVSKNELMADRLNFRFGGLYEMLPDWITPERGRMKTLLVKDQAAVKKLKQQLLKAQSMAGAKDVAKIDQEIVKAKERRAQVIAEVQDIDADLIKARQREQITRPVPIVKNSRLVPSHKADVSL